MIVCVCNNISDRDIAREVAAGCASFGQLQMRTGVAAGCGCCHDCARESFAEHRSRQQAAGSAVKAVGSLAGIPLVSSAA